MAYFFNLFWCVNSVKQNTKKGKAVISQILQRPKQNLVARRRRVDEGGAAVHQTKQLKYPQFTNIHPLVSTRASADMLKAVEADPHSTKNENKDLTEALESERKVEQRCSSRICRCSRCEVGSLKEKHRIGTFAAFSSQACFPRCHDIKLPLRSREETQSAAADLQLHGSLKASLNIYNQPASAFG